MDQVLMCIADGHDIRLVLAAALICGFAAANAMSLFRPRPESHLHRQWRIALSSAIAGGGVWATHFVAMLAFDRDVPMTFDIIGTSASLACAILGMGLGFAFALRGGVWRGLGGATAGLSIATMHFIGITAMRLQARMVWDPTFVAISVSLAILLSAAAFLTQRGRGPGRWAAATGLMMLAVLSLHFTAMTALTLVPDPSVILTTGTVSRPMLAVAVVAVTLLLLAAPFAVLKIERTTQRRTLLTMRRSLDAIPGGMAFFDENDRLVAWNAAYSDITGALGVEAYEGLPRSAMLSAARRVGWIPDDVSAEVIAELQTWRDRGADDVRMPDGRWMRHQQFGLDGGGGVTKFTDVTAQKELVEALTAAKESAESASRAKTAFLANISHEIRTPLNGLMSATELLSRRPLELEERRLVEMQQASGALLNELLSDLLDLARIDAGAVELRPAPTQVAAVAADVEKIVSASARLKGLALQTCFSGCEDDWVMCDATRLTQVLSHLMSNAVKFTGKGRVTLSVRREAERLSFRVEDTGVGFDADQRQRIFERFTQADASATRDRGGAGLGLTIAAELVRLMGGELDCISEPGVGSTFMFTLDLPAVPSPSLTKGVAAPGLTADRVLIVDDNEMNRRVLATILDTVGIDHSEAVNGLEALEAFNTEAFSAILMDIQMPVMDGLEATRRIRKLERDTDRARTPVFVVSANCLQEHVEASFAAGADAHFGKPIPIPQLLDALAEPAAFSAQVA